MSHELDSKAPSEPSQPALFAPTEPTFLVSEIFGMLPPSNKEQPIKPPSYYLVTMDSFVKTHIAPKGVVCLCGSGECKGFSAAFKLLKDSRKRFVKLPPFLDDGSNQQRECYLRYLLPRYSVSMETPSNYIAMHHFDPTIVSQYKNKIPTTLSCGLAVELRVALSDKDKVVDENGLPAFLFCPSYPPAKVKQDLAKLAARDSSSTVTKSSDIKKATTKVVAQPDTTKQEMELVDKVETTKSESSSVKVPTFVTVALYDDEQSDISSIPHEQPHEQSQDDDDEHDSFLGLGNHEIDKDPFSNNNKTTILDLDEIVLFDSEFFNAHDEIAQLKEESATLPSSRECCLHTQHSFCEIQRKSIQVQILLKELLGTVNVEGNNEELQVLVEQVMNAVNDIEVISAAHVAPQL